MPWTYTIQRDQNVILTQATGVLTEEELTRGVKAAYQDPAFHHGLNALLDYSAVTEWRVPGKTLAALAARRSISDKAKTAIVVSGPIGNGMGRVYDAWVEQGQLKIFMDRNEALAWLNDDASVQEKT